MNNSEITDQNSVTAVKTAEITFHPFVPTLTNVFYKIQTFRGVTGGLAVASLILTPKLTVKDVRGEKREFPHNKALRRRASINALLSLQIALRKSGAYKKETDSTNLSDARG